MLQNTVTFIAIINIDADLLRRIKGSHVKLRRYVAERASIPTRCNMNFIFVMAGSNGDLAVT
jgi:hypothetical protein